MASEPLTSDRSDWTEAPEYMLMVPRESPAGATLFADGDRGGRCS